jgi:Rrf2 family protein
MIFSDGMVSEARLKPGFIIFERMLSVSCKYALRAVLFLVMRQGEKAGIREIADYIDANEHTTAKILQLLTKEAIIHSVKGPNGGFYFEKRKKPLYLIDVVRLVDGTGFFTACALGLAECSDRKPCPIHYQYKEVRETLHRQFCTITLDSLSEDVSVGKSFLKR